MTTLGNGLKHRTPSGYKVAPQSYASLELAANSLRPMLPTEAAPSGAYRIDGWRVLEKMLPKAGYHPHIASVRELAEQGLDDCAGFTVPDEGLVVIRRDVYDGLFRGSVFSRSTVIHELAHIVLKHNVTMHRGATVGQHEFFEDSEWQAKAMTAAVMMPLDACRKAADAAELAEMCGTSIEAAGYRLQRLRKDKVLLRQTDLF